jgi:hypothetical protein
MDDGILGINLLPAWSPSSVKSELVATLSRAELLQAGIGYSTIQPDLLGPPMVRALSNDSGFACVDLHLPTDVDALAALRSKGAHVYVYYEDIPTYTDTGRKEPPYLLHSKMMLFWSKDRIGDLWVGSHNWTNRAILGLNVEAALVVRLRDSSALFASAAEYLAKMRSISEPFDLAKVHFYKETQKRMSQGLAPVIELEAEGGGALDGATIAVFGTDVSDLRRVGTVRREVNVALFDPHSDGQFLYPAHILHSGLLAASDSAAGGISFSPRRHAFRMGQRFALLQPEGPVEKRVLDTARYFVTLRLGSLNSTLTAEYPPARTVFFEELSAESSPLLERLDLEARTRLFRGRQPQVKRPVMVSEDIRPRTVAERRQLPEHPLVSLRLLLPKNP